MERANAYAGIGLVFGAAIGRRVAAAGKRPMTCSRSKQL